MFTPTETKNAIRYSIKKVYTKTRNINMDNIFKDKKGNIVIGQKTFD